MADPGSSTKLQRAGQGGCVPARYLAPKPFSSRKFPGLRKQWGTSKGVKIGGDQIEHEDEDPRIGRMLEEEAAKGGACPRRRYGLAYFSTTSAAEPSSTLAALLYLPAHVGDLV